MRKLRLTLLRSKMKKRFPLFVCGDALQVQDYIGGRGTFALKRGQKWNSPKLVLFHKCFRAQRGRISSLLPKCAGQNYVTWNLVCLWQFDSWFRFAVAASEIVTVISSNFSFISFWRSFRGIFWEALWILKLTQSQVGIVGIKIVNSLNRINRCVK